MTKSSFKIICLLVFIAGLGAGNPALAEQKSGFGLGFEMMQKVWRGISKSPKMTTCRLANRTVYKGKQICVYAGANNTLVGIYNESGDYCSGAMDCRYDPGGGKTIGELVQAFKDAEDK